MIEWLSAFVAAIVWPLDWALGLAMRTLLAASEGFDGVEWGVLRVGRWLIAPLGFLWRLSRAALTAVVPQSLRNALGAPFRWAALSGHRFRMAIVHLVEMLNLDGVVVRLVKWTSPLWYPFAAAGGFFHAWLLTRNYRQLIWGLPVILVLLPLIGIAGWTMLWGRGSIAAQYRQAANEARQAKDYERVRLFERKLAQLGVATEFARFQTAIALAQDGKHTEAYEAMKQLAPVESPGYVQAHFWIVDQLLKNTLSVSNDESHRLVKIHLDHLQALGMRGPQMDWLRAAWLALDNQPVEAAKVLAPIASGFAPAALMRLEINLQLKNVAAARADARLVCTHMEDHLRRGASLSADEYRFWAVAEELLGNITKAHELVGKWVELEPENAAARAILAELSWRLVQKALETVDPAPEHLAALVLEAAEMTNNPSELRQQVERLYRLRSELPMIHEVIQRVAENDRASGRTLEALGTMAARHGDLEQARDYLRRALSKNPKNAVAWNNYAWITVQLPDGDPQDSLRAVNQALAIKPDDYRFRETRGQILVRLGKWQEAIADLEFAANGMPDSREVHLALAKVYDALGDKQLAEVHRERAN
jgi:tetratricopeptide (TPR) repeat protein